MNSTVFPTSGAYTKVTRPATTLQDIEAAVNKLRGHPPDHWLLMAPDGRVWADPDVSNIARVALGQMPLGSY